MKSKFTIDLEEKLFEGVKDLPTLPTIYSAIADAISNPRSTIDDIAKIISADQAAAIKVLKVVNSPFYGFSGKIDTISTAILHLGFHEVRNIVLALSVINLFSKNNKFINFRPAEFWSHSIAVGIATRLIGELGGEKNLENYFLAGILHDIGKLLFFNLIKEEYSEVIQVTNERLNPIWKIEDELLGIDHAQAGYIIAEKWHLPESIKLAIKYHEKCDQKENNYIISSVHLGNIFARMMDFGYAGDIIIQKPNAKAFKYLNLPKAPFSKIYDNFVESFNKTVSTLL